MNSISDPQDKDDACSQSTELIDLNIKLKNGAKIENKNKSLKIDENHNENLFRKTTCKFYRDSNDLNSNGKIEKNSEEYNNININELTSSTISNCSFDSSAPKINKCYENDLDNIKRGIQYKEFGNKLQSDGRYPEAKYQYKVARYFDNPEAMYNLGEIYEYDYQNKEKALKNYRISAKLGFPDAIKKLNTTNQDGDLDAN